MRYPTISLTKGNWTFLPRRHASGAVGHARKKCEQSVELLINADVFRNEFGGKYILSRAKLSNAADLGFDFVGKWDSVEGVYTMYVYEMK